MREMRCQLRDIEVGNADERDFPLIPQLCQRRPGFLDRTGIVSLRAGRPDRPVNLVQIDALRLQTAEALFDLPANRLRIEAVPRISRRVPHEAALREHVRPVAARDIAQCLPDDFLRMAEPVDRGRVNPVETPIDRAPNRRDGVGVVLRPPPESPLAADRPGAQADRRQFQGRVAQ